ncbi:DUF4179 domain-containing protein [Clostridium tagluense]|uniref:DUF4179 domain-containing protein n=1 Tax=Clostridium tagluense TaxID=360422 RepID=UPI001C0E0A43|nr:DUF4179 domain-containing protein [Clostridium tagluense]MBU3129147.1 DUF4179 domain-containing protein [Clostridium tagluense]
MNDKLFDIGFIKNAKNIKTKVPHVVSDRIDKTLALLPEKETENKKNKHGSRILKNKRVRQSIAAAAVTLTVLTISATISPVMANTLSNIPVIGSVFKLFGDKGLKLASEKGVSSLVGQPKVDKGIKVTIRDILYDGARMSVGYTMEGNNIGELGKSDLLVNDTPINAAMSYTGSAVTKNTYAGVINVSPTSELPENFKLTVLLNKIGNTKGNWEFKNIPVKKQKSSVNSKVTTPMVTKPIGKGSITIEKILVSDTTIKLNIIETNLPREKFYSYQVIDNYGNVLKPLSGSGLGEGSIMNQEYTFEPLNNNPKHFVIKVSDRNENAGSEIIDVKVKVEDKFPIILSQGDKGGQVSVNKIEYLKDKTLVHYTYKGNDPYGNGLCVWVEDKKGNNLDNPRQSTQRNIDGSYILECFRINKNKKIKVATRELSESKFLLEFEIPLK